MKRPKKATAEAIRKKTYKLKKRKNINIGRIIEVALKYYIILEIAEIIFNDKEIQKQLKELRKLFGIKRMKKVLKI